MNKPKSFFPSDKQQNLFIMISRLPRPELMISSVNRLDEKTVSRDTLQGMSRNWPEEFADLMQEAQDNPEYKWDKAENYFITLG